MVADGRGLVLVLVRGDHRVNEIKLANALGTTFRAAHEDEIRERIGPPGYIGPVGSRTFRSCSTRPSRTAATSPAPTIPTTTCAASSPAATSRSSASTCAPSRPATRSTAHPITIEPAIEIGNIFKLGTRYSEPLGATYLDEDGKEQLVGMGSYGIGPARIVAAAIEQFADEQGISWPRALAPWDVEVIGLGKGTRRGAGSRPALYDELRAAGLDVLLDDRDAGPGEKFADAELLGAAAAADRRASAGWRPGGRGADPPRPRGRRGRRAARGSRRRGQDAVGHAPVDGATAAERARLTFRRLVGLDRSGPPPPADAAGRAAAPVDDPERDRVRPPRADPGLPGPRVSSESGTDALPGHHLRGHRLERLRRRHRRARDRPVQPLRRAAGPDRRPAAGHHRRGRLLELRAAAALGAGRHDRPRGVHARRRPARAATRNRPCRSTGWGAGACGRRCRRSSSGCAA